MAIRYCIAAMLGLMTFAGLYFSLESIKVPTDDLSLTLHAEVLQDDAFQLFYQQTPEIGFEGDKMVDQVVAGQEGVQAISFELPKGIPVYKLRLDLGSNSSQAPISLQSISLKSGETEWAINDSIFNYFNPNAGIVPQEGQLQLREMNGAYDPFLISIPLTDEIEALKSGSPLLPLWLLLALSSFGTIAMMAFAFQLDVSSIEGQWEQVAFLTVFAGMLILPFLAENFDLEPKKKSKEKRVLAEKPDFEWNKDYPEKYEDYYNDQFGWRNSLVMWSSQIKVDWLRVSPQPNQVMMGADQFLFFNEQYSFKSYSRSQLYPEQGLVEILESLVSRKQLLDERGIEFVMGFWPAKHTIYADKLPLQMRMQQVDTLPQADLLMAKCNANELPIVDVRPSLIELSKTQQTYRKLDTHWNERGAFCAYQAFFKQTFSQLGIEPYPLDSFEVSTKRSVTGDLVNMLALDSIRGYEELVPKIKFKGKSERFPYQSTVGFPGKTIITHNQYAADRRKVLMFRDSYTSAMLPFLALHFKDITFIWDNYKQELVDQVNPDIVICCNAERFVLHL